MTQIKIENFISHADFGLSHIPRNIALHEYGVKTWYFIDSANCGANFRYDEKDRGYKHPFWAYLCYDNYVTWDDFLSRYYEEHPGPAKRSHVVGCLWAQHLMEKEASRHKLFFSRSGSQPCLKDKFIIAAFDSTYGQNSIGSYAEGIRFASDLLQLVTDDSDIIVVMKQKKPRYMHKKLDPVLGDRLLDIYEKMKENPRAIVYGDQADASTLISASDMVVSFAFTSTTFEALSVDKPAIWHDPMGYYKDTIYGRLDGVVTHEYIDLKKRVKEIKEMGTKHYRNPIETGSPLLDPYRDGRAITRFGEHLAGDMAYFRKNGYCY